MAYTPNERRILSFTAVAHFAVHFFEQMFPTAAVAIALDSGLPIQTVLAWSFYGYLLFGLGALPAGFLTDHWRASRMLQLCLVGSGAASVLVGLSSPGSGITAALGALGLFSSIFHPAGMGLIAGGVRERGRALGLNGIFGNIGIASAPAVSALTIGFIGWRGGYVFFGVVLLLAGIASLGATIEEPARGEATEQRHESDGVSTVTLSVLLGVCMMLGGISYRGTSLATPAYFAERVSAVHYGFATSLVYLVGTVSQYWGGQLADRHDLRWLYLRFHLASLPALLAMAMLSGTPLVFAAATFVFFSIGMQPIENSLVARLTPPAWRSTSYGIKFVLTFGVGSIATRIVEVVKDRADLSAVFLTLAVVVTLLAAFAGLLIALSGRTAVRNLRHELPGDLVAEA
jgi:MFS family permease